MARHAARADNLTPVVTSVDAPAAASAYTVEAVVISRRLPQGEGLLHDCKG